MKITAISDTHSSHEDLRLKGGDILIVAGDILGYGTREELIKFNGWLGRQDYAYKVVIPGNHDKYCSVDPQDAKNLLSSGELLIHEAKEIAGIKIFGSPWTPVFMEWSFMYDRRNARDKWEAIPKDTQLLITHGPAYGTGLGITPYGGDAGCVGLADKIKELHSLKLHVCGHIHCGRGYAQLGNVDCFNVSVLDEQYMVSHEPTEIEWR